MPPLSLHGKLGGHGVAGESKRMGGATGAAQTPKAQMASSVFDLDPSVSSQGYYGRKEDDVPTKPHRAAFQPAPARAPVDVSDGAPAADAPALARQRSSELQRDVETICESLRAALRARGAVGIRGIARNFQICDTDGSKKLDHDELKKCLRLCKLSLSEAEFGKLFTLCDSDGSGKVEYDEFLRVVRGRLPPLRRKLIVSVFNTIDARARESGIGLGDGKLTLDDIRAFYNAKQHPEVKAGKKTESAVLQEMLYAFEGTRGNRDGTVTLEEWIAYYEELSASIDHDEHFNTTVVGAWSYLFDAAVMGDAALPRPVPSYKVDEVERALIQAIRIRSSGNSETRALEQTFKQFDANKNGTIEFSEFRTAMERFGLATGPPPGITVDVIVALFDRYDPDGSGELSYDEFIKGVFKLDNAPTSARAVGKDLASGCGTSLPLPSERGGTAGPPNGNTSYARGRGGVMGGGMNAGVAPTAGASSARRAETGAAGSRSAFAGDAFNTSSGIFR